MNVEVDGALVAAHELKAPLAVLRQLAFSLDEMEPRDERIRSEMISVSERAIRQVDDLTKVGRLEDGLFEMEPVSVRAVCDDAVRELENLFCYNHRKLFAKYSNKSRLVIANRDLLHSVIYNFLLNAIRYSDEESVAKMIVKDSRGKVRIAIRDYGPELPIDIWRELRNGQIGAPVSVAMRSGSSGLGLYIASKFSHYMHAEVGAVRHRDGTSFFVELPVSSQASLFV